MGSRRLDKTLADYVTIAISPVLIMLMVGSLMFFLLAAAYAGDYDERLRWILSCFVVAIVLIARISIEEGKERAALFALALGMAVGLAIMRFVNSALLVWAVMAVVWWASHKLTYDCTLIDEEDDASGEGLLQVVGLDRESSDMAAPAAQAAANTPASAESSSPNKGNGVSPGKVKAKRKRRASAPGTWVIYFSLAALPLFGLGQWMVPASDTAARQRLFNLLCVYVASGLGLLLTTSFLGLRRYLRQRKLQMPAYMAGVWLAVGAALIVVILTISALIPRPNPEYEISSITGKLGSQDRSSSEHAVMSDSGRKDHGSKGGEQSKQSGDNQQQQSPEEGKSAEQPPDDANREPSDANSAGNSNPAESGSPDAKGQGAAKKNDPQGKPEAGQTDSQRGSEQQGGSGGQKPGSGGQSGSSGQKGSGSGKQGSSGQQGAKSGGQKSSGDKNPAEQEKGQKDDQKKDQKQEQPSQSGKQSAQTPPPPSEPPPPPKSPTSLSDVFGWLASALRWALNLAILAAVIYALIRYRQEIVAGWRQLLQSLRDFWQRWFGGVRRAQELAQVAVVESKPQPRPFASYADPFRTGLANSATPEQLVNYSFEALEAWAAERGLARRPDETPLEFAEKLAAEHPQAGSVVRELTGLYARMAYARQRLTPASLEAVRRFWQRIPRIPESERATAMAPNV